MKAAALDHETRRTGFYSERGRHARWRRCLSEGDGLRMGIEADRDEILEHAAERARAAGAGLHGKCTNAASAFHKSVALEHLQRPADRHAGYLKLIGERHFGWQRAARPEGAIRQLFSKYDIELMVYGEAGRVSRSEASPPDRQPRLGRSNFGSWQKALLVTPPWTSEQTLSM
jgi:hypothetical protein